MTAKALQPAALSDAVSMMRAARILLCNSRCEDALELYQRSLPILCSALDADTDTIAKAMTIVLYLKAATGQADVVRLVQQALESRQSQDAGNDTGDQIERTGRQLAAIARLIVHSGDGTAHGEHFDLTHASKEAAAEHAATRPWVQGETHDHDARVSG
jgi:hypothetical protein